MICAQMSGTIDDFDLWKALAQTIHHGIGVGIHDDFVDLRHGEEGLDDVMEERLAGQWAVILARHALGMMTHGNEGGEAGHGSNPRLCRAVVRKLLQTFKAFLAVSRAADAPG